MARSFNEIKEDAAKERECIAAALQQRLALPADAFTMAWVQRELAKFHTELSGLASVLFRQASNTTAIEGRLRAVDEIHGKVQDSMAAIGELLTRVAAIEASVATVGDVMARISSLEQRMERMAAWAQGQQRQQAQQVKKTSDE